MKKNYEKLIKALDEYIEFLGDHINSNASYLHVHGISTSEEDVEKGAKMRSKIKKLRKQLPK